MTFEMIFTPCGRVAIAMGFVDYVTRQPRAAARGVRQDHVQHILCRVSKKFPIVLQYFFESAVANRKSRSASLKFARRLV